MKFRYSEWRDEQDRSKLTFDELMRLFSQLLLYSNGSVPEALQMMTDLDNDYNIFDENDGLDFDEFLDWLKKEGYIDEFNDILALTHKGPVCFWRLAA